MGSSIGPPKEQVVSYCFRWPGDRGQITDFRPVALRRRFSPALPLSIRLLDSCLTNFCYKSNIYYFGRLAHCGSVKLLNRVEN